MKRKTTALLLAAALILTMSACGNQVPGSSGNTVVAAAGSDVKPKFDPSGTIEETVLVDKNGIKVTATELKYSKYAATLTLSLENNGSTDVTVLCGTNRYSSNSVNGVMYDGAYINCKLSSGGKTEETITFKYDDLMLHGINEIADIELGFYSEDSDRNYVYYPISQIKTSVSDKYTYDKAAARKALTSLWSQNENEYKATYLSEEKLYDADDVSIVSEVMIESKEGHSVLLLEALNDSPFQTLLFVSDITINGVKVTSGKWTGHILNPNKSAWIQIDLDRTFNRSYWELYGINEIKSVKMDVGQTDVESGESSKTETIEVAFAGGECTADTSGITAYDEGNIKVIYKGIAGGTYESDDDLYVKLLVQNESGQKIYVDADDVIINGKTASTSVYSKTVDDGDCAAWEIDINDSSFSACGISEASDIKDIEFTLEIRDEHWSNKSEEKATIKIT